MPGLIKNEWYKMYRRRKWVLFMGAVLLLEAVTIFQLLSTPQEERAIELNG